MQRLNTRATRVWTAPPMAANQGAARGDNATDRRAPHISVFFQFQITPKSVTRAGKIARQGGKSGKKIVGVGNPIWNTFHNLQFFQIFTDFELF
jgi:hypothetical protein